MITISFVVGAKDGCPVLAVSILRATGWSSVRTDNWLMAKPIAEMVHIRNMITSEYGSVNDPYSAAVRDMNIQQLRDEHHEI